MRPLPHLAITGPPARHLPLVLFPSVLKPLLANLSIPPSINRLAADQNLLLHIPRYELLGRKSAEQSYQSGKLNGHFHPFDAFGLQSVQPLGH